MAAAMPGKESYLAAFELAQNEWVRGLIEWRFHALFMNVGKSGHGVQPAAADNANFCLRQPHTLFLRGAILTPAAPAVSNISV
jgi:hypothetical protein